MGTLKTGRAGDDPAGMSRTCGAPVPPDVSCATGRLLLATRVESTALALRELAQRRAGAFVELAPGAFELHDRDPDELLFSAHARLSATENDEVRGLLIGCGVPEREVLAQALTAPTLGQLVRSRLGVSLPGLDGPDAATGLPDRWSMLEQLEASIDRCGELGRSVAVLLLALDEEVPDHRVLVEVADRLRAALRGSDLLARAEDLELGAVLADLDHLDAERVAQRVAEDLLSALARPVVLDGRVVRVTARVGIALFPRHGWTGTQLLGCADVALHSARAAGERVALAGG